MGREEEGGMEGGDITKNWYEYLDHVRREVREEKALFCEYGL